MIVLPIHGTTSKSFVTSLPYAKLFMNCVYVTP